MKNKFKTKAGLLTPYALHCGYIQTFGGDNGRVTLWHEGGPLYHVRGENWESFEKLKDARKQFNLEKRKIKKLLTLADKEV